MALKDRLEAARNEDPRLVELKIAKRNFERRNFGWRHEISNSSKKRVLGSGLFEIVGEIVSADPDSHLEIDGNIHTPSVFWSSDDQRHSLEFTIYSFNVRDFQIISRGWDPMYKDISMKMVSEVIPISKLNREYLEKSTVNFLTMGGFDLSKVKRLNYAAEDPFGYFAALGLHPHAFKGVDDQVVEELIKRSYRFWAEIHHPDKGGDPEIMKRLNNARDFFMDPKNRE